MGKALGYKLGIWDFGKVHNDGKDFLDDDGNMNWGLMGAAYDQFDENRQVLIRCFSSQTP